MGSGNKLLADMLRWSWDCIRDGRPDAVNVMGKNARDTMESCVRLVEDTVPTSEEEREEDRTDA